MRRNLIIVGLLALGASAFFLLVAGSVKNPSDFQRQLAAARARASAATYSIVYQHERTMGKRIETATETAVRLDVDSYRSETTDDTGYTIIVIERPDGRFQCESSQTIVAQCYRTDVRPSLVGFDEEVEFPALDSHEVLDAVDIDSLEVTQGEKTQRSERIDRRVVAEETATCYVEHADDMRFETCYAIDGLPLYSSSSFDLAGQSFVLTSEAVTIDRSPDAIDLALPFELVERPTITGDLQPIIELPTP